MAIYKVIQYKNPVKNEDGMWAVERLEDNGICVTINSEDDLKDACKSLKKEKIISTSDLRRLSISDIDKDIIEIKEKKGMKPICRLEIQRWMEI